MKILHVIDIHMLNTIVDILHGIEIFHFHRVRSIDWGNENITSILLKGKMRFYLNGLNLSMAHRTCIHIRIKGIFRANNGEDWRSEKSRSAKRETDMLVVTETTNAYLIFDTEHLKLFDRT
jgi:hypothetical protein